MLYFKKSLLACSVAGSALLGMPAFSATVTTTFDVTITLEAACQISGVIGGAPMGAGDLDFGTHPAAISANIDADNAGTATGGIAVLCTDGLAYDIGFNNGVNFSGGSRRMAGTTDFVNYALYRDTGRTLLWGDLGSGNELSATGNGLRQTYPVYGRVPAGQAPDITGAAETFTDTVTVTVEF